MDGMVPRQAASDMVKEEAAEAIGATLKASTGQVRRGAEFARGLVEVLAAK